MTGPAQSTRATSWSGTRASMPKGVAAKVRRRDKTCRGCGATHQLQVDHIVPVAEARLMGWTDDMIDHVDNGQLLCPDCHNAKSRAERARGLARRRAALARPQRSHPGLVT